MIDPLTVRGKRLAALDYGNARIGVAVCDEMHIVVSTRPVINNDANVLKVLSDRFAMERTDVVLVGVPKLVQEDAETDIIKEIRVFIERLRETLSIPVLETDEAFSSKRAREMMFSTGMKKKRRREKGTKDQLAAAIILKDFLSELEMMP
ncbi:Holliday junction resolvase RuvX [soil metagenome]